MSTQYYETWYVSWPYYSIEDDSGLISGDSYRLMFTNWNTYQNMDDPEGASSVTVDGIDLTDTYVNNAEGVEFADGVEIVYTLPEDSTLVDYDIVWGNTTHSGSYPVRIALTYGDNPENPYTGGYTGGLPAFHITFGQGGVARPSFTDIEYDYNELTLRDELGGFGMPGETDSGRPANLPKKWDVLYSVNYDGEMGTIKERWQHYSADNGADGYPTSFKGALGAVIDSLIQEIHAYSPQVDNPEFVFNKTKQARFPKTSIFSDEDRSTATVSLDTFASTSESTTYVDSDTGLEY